MDPHNDFGKYDIAPATNTAYSTMRQQRDDLLALVQEASEIMTRTYGGMFPAGIESFLVRAQAAVADVVKSAK